MQTSPESMQIRTVVYFDGRVVAESVSARVAHASTFPRKAPQGDTYASYAAPD